MKPRDVIAFSTGGIAGYRARTVLMLLAMCTGVASVVVLTAIGEGARRYVTGEFAALGTHLLIVLPGRSETVGGAPPLMGATPRDLTLGDAVALERGRAVRRVAPVALGSALVSWRQREREVNVIGTTPSFLEIRRLGLAQGRFLPATRIRRGSPVSVIGGKIKRELFGSDPALGQWVRIGDRRFRVVGVFASEGRSIGLDMEETVAIPVASALALFNTPSLFRILVEARTRAGVATAKEAIYRIIRERHEGEEDVTVITQDALISTFDGIFRALTLTVGGIAAISLAVAGILIMNVMLVAVAQRAAEIGLLKALGASWLTILSLFLAEAALLSSSGAALGVLLGYGLIWLVRDLYPVIPLAAPAWAVVSAVAIALGTGLLFGALPARRAAALDPVVALARH